MKRGQHTASAASDGPDASFPEARTRIRDASAASAMAGRGARATAMRVAVLVVGLLAASRTASAHPLDLGYGTIETHGNDVSLRLELAVETAAKVLAVDEAALTTTSVPLQARALADATFATASIATDAGSCTWQPPTATRVERTISIEAIAACPTASGPRVLSFPFVAEAKVAATFELMVKTVIDGAERFTLVDRANPTISLGASSGEDGFAAFVWSGIEHIGASPSEWHDAGGMKLADGIDHILFLLALMLGGGTLLQLIAIASGFTLGHSITLALSALDVVRPPETLIEPLIALTISLAAIEAFTRRFHRHRWKLATGFGLIHGFGFALALGHLELSTLGKAKALAGYNLGVELGQVAIVLVIAPVLLLLQRNQRFGRPMTRIAAAAIFIAGLYWFVERALL